MYDQSSGQYTPSVDAAGQAAGQLASEPGCGSSLPDGPPGELQVLQADICNDDFGHHLCCEPVKESCVYLIFE